MRRRWWLWAGVASGLALVCAVLAWSSSTAVPASRDWDAAVSACTDPELFACVEGLWSDAAAADDLPGLAGALAVAAPQDSNLARVCHDAAHAAGQQAVVRFPERVRSWLVWSGDPSLPCESGFLHGQLEGIGLAADPSLLDAAFGVCAEVDRSDPASGDSCAHGVGHGVFLLRQDVPSSWVDCRSGAGSVSWSDRLRERCLGGVLMLRVQTDERWDAPAASAQARELLQEVTVACEELPGLPASSQVQCAAWAAWALAADASAAVVTWQFDGGSRAVATKRVNAAVAACAALPELVQVQQCQAAVADVAGSAFLGFSQVSRSACSVFPSDLVPVCRDAAAGVSRQAWLPAADATV